MVLQAYTTVGLQQYTTVGLQHGRHPTHPWMDILAAWADCCTPGSTHQPTTPRLRKGRNDDTFSQNSSLLGNVCFINLLLLSDRYLGLARITFKSYILLANMSDEVW